MVGDDDQAIYQWRGGDVELFVRFAQRYQTAATHQLGENHRCRPEIVSFAKAVVHNLPGRLPKVIESAREKAHPGAVEILIEKDPEDEARAASRIASKGFSSRITGPRTSRCSFDPSGPRLHRSWASYETAAFPRR